MRISDWSSDVCSSDLYNEIVALRPDWHDEDPEQGAIMVVMTGSASAKALLRPHIYLGQVKKRLEKRFKDPKDPLPLVLVISDERSVGKECVRTCSSRWSQYH